MKINMPLPNELALRLARGELKVKGAGDYYDKLPELKAEDFPDNLTLRELSMSGLENGKKLHTRLKSVGLTRSQRAGITNVLGVMTRIGESEITVGDIRALKEGELMRLRESFSWGIPSANSIRKVKKLFG